MRLGGADLFSEGPMLGGLNFRPPRWGRVFGLGQDSDTEDSGRAGPMGIVRGTPVVNGPAAVEEFDWHFFVQGERVSVGDNPDFFIVPEVDGAWRRDIDVIGSLRDATADPWASSNLFHAVPVGSDIVLTWDDMPTEDDFKTYKVYWDQGLGGAVDTLLATVTEKDTTSYVHEGLSSGTYVYKILYEDLAGNIGNGAGGDNGQTASATINAIPDAPTIALDSTADFGVGVSRTISLTLTPPADTTGIVAYYWAVAYSPIDGFLRYAESRLHLMVDKTTGAPNLSRGVFPGVWRFVAFSATKEGILSNASNEVAMRYVDDGAGGLDYEAGAGPSRSTDLIATAQSGGDIKLDCTLETNVSASGGVSFERDGSEVGTQAFQSSNAYTFTDTGLVDGTVYTYRVRAYDPTSHYGEYSNEASAKSDATAPSGDQVLTARVR